MKCPACGDRGFWYSEDNGQLVTCSCLAAQIIASPHKVKTSDKDYKRHLNRILSQGITVEELAVRIGQPVSWIKEKLK